MVFALHLMLLSEHGPGISIGSEKFWTGIFKHGPFRSICFFPFFQSISSINVNQTRRDYLDNLRSYMGWRQPNESWR
jgi:hypothetical protein